MRSLSNKSKKRSAKKKSAAELRRPFAPKVWKQATDLAKRYQVIMHFEDGAYYGTGLEIPGANGDGPDPAACLKDVREAMAAVVGIMIEDGQQPPVPASSAGRAVQVNIRMSPREKLMVEELSRQQGFRGISDYIRAKAIHA